MKGGRPSGRKNDATLDREESRKAFELLVLERLRPLFEAQMTLARGVSYLYRIKKTKNGEEHVLVTSQYEIGKVLEKIHVGGAGTVDGEYFYITTRAPENRARSTACLIVSSASPINPSPAQAAGLSK